MSYYFPVSIGDRCGGGGHLSVPVSLTYADIILQLYSPGGVEVDLLECLSHDIVGLSLAGLGCLDGSGLVYVTLVVDIELAEGVCQAEYVVLLELGELPVVGGEMVSPLVSRCLSSAQRSSIVGCARRRGRGLREWWDSYLCSLRTFMIACVCTLCCCWLEMLGTIWYWKGKGSEAKELRSLRRSSSPGRGSHVGGK